jgi:hypothetical protein
MTEKDCITVRVMTGRTPLGRRLAMVAGVDHGDYDLRQTAHGGRGRASPGAIAAQALYRLRARPVTAVPAEFTLWNRGCPL